VDRGKGKSNAFTGAGWGTGNGFEDRRERGVWRLASTGRVCGFGVRRDMSRLEAVDRNGVVAGADLETEKMRGMLENLVGSPVKRSQRRMRRWRADKNIGGVEKVRR
jgi:hypothetical protein